ncbi:DUF2524 family protein [Aquibacillus kalidii]|uniref:DUF2524 family protein n=1 Tax=Aquibacillus kalidii TaxID=2762597 RepID=UPI0016489110|nr:DUF2524 family protein [Aquibacillus kalidii]
MATRESVDNLIQRANQCITEAEQQLSITNRNGNEVDSAYSEVQRKLGDIEAEIQQMKNSASHEQRDQLHRTHMAVSNYMNDMILDHIQINDVE